MSYLNRYEILAIFFLLAFPLYSPAQIITTIAGTGITGFTGDGGLADTAEIQYPKGIIVKPSGNIYFSDQLNQRIRYINPAGVITTFAGTGFSGYSGDGGAATLAKINNVFGMTIDGAGNLLFVDENNYRVRRVTPSGIITTVAGTGTAGYNGDGIAASAAQLNRPFDVACDNLGNIYISDQQQFRVRKIDPSGIITTYAGDGALGTSLDGVAATSTHISPVGLAVDASGNLYFSESNRIRKVNTSGIISTVAGTWVSGYSGDGGPATAAQINSVYGIAIDNLGNLYICDKSSNRIRKVNTAGIITTVAGNGTAGYTGDGIPATAAELNGPEFISVNCAGDIYITDNVNQRIRKVTFDHVPMFTGGHTESCVVCETDINFSIDSLLAVDDIDTGQTETWSLASSPLHGTVVSACTTTSTGGTLIPSGLSYTPASGYTGNDTFRICITDCALATDTVSIYVSVISPITLAAITGADSVCIGHTITLSETFAGGGWYANNAKATVSSGGVVTGVLSGKDTILYIASNACGSDTMGHVVNVKLCTSYINSITPEYNAVLYPNPSMGTFSFLLSSPYNEELYITITNLMGKKIKELTTITNYTTEVALDAPAGVYFVNVFTAHESWSGKMAIAY